MAKFRKVVLPAPGVYHTPDGPVAISADRIRGWAEKFRALQSNRIKIPVSWGHQSRANPVAPGDVDGEEFLRSRYNATYLDALEVTPAGGLVAVAEAPPGWEVEARTGSLVNPTDGTRIAEVSLAARDWVDGEGRLWKDAPRHLALTPLPVVHRTPGFERAGDGPATGEVRLSLSDYRGPVRLASTETPPMKREEQDEEQDEGGEEVAPESEAPDAMGGGYFKRALAMLAAADIPLPEDTTPENAWERLYIVLTAMQAAKETAEAEAPAPTTQPKEEPMPTMLSLIRHTDPAVRALAARVASEDRAKRKARIDALERLADPNGIPRVPPTQIRRWRELASGVQLSLTGAGQAVPTELDQQLELAESLLGVELATRLPAGAREEEPPEGEGDREVKKEAEERGKRLSRA